MCIRDSSGRAFRSTSPCRCCLLCNSCRFECTNQRENQRVSTNVSCHAMHHALVSSQFACTVRFTYPAAAGTGDLDQDPLRGLPAPAIPVGAGVGVLAFLAKRIADLYGVAKTAETSASLIHTSQPFGGVYLRRGDRQRRQGRIAWRGGRVRSSWLLDNGFLQRCSAGISWNSYRELGKDATPYFPPMMKQCLVLRIYNFRLKWRRPKFPAMIFLVSDTSRWHQNRDL